MNNNTLSIRVFYARCCRNKQPWDASTQSMHSVISAFGTPGAREYSVISSAFFLGTPGTRQYSVINCSGGGLVQCSRYRPNQRIYGSRVLSHYRFFGASVTRERSVISALVVLAHPKPTTECGVWSPVLYATYVKNLLVLVRLVML